MNSPWARLAFCRFSVIVLSIFVSSPSSLFAIVIGLDAVNGAQTNGVTTAILATGENYQAFRNTIVGQGYTIANVTSFSPASLAGVDAVILRHATTIPYSASDIANIQAFVASGRGAMFLSEAATANAATLGNFNSLVAPYGVTFSTTTLGGTGFDISSFVPHPVTNGLLTVGLDFYRTIESFNSPAIDLTVQSGEFDFLAAVNGANGRGNVVLIGDGSQWSLTNGAPGSDRPITFGSNRLLLQNSVAFIAGRATATVPEPSTFLIFSLGSTLVLGSRRQRQVFRQS